MADQPDFIPPADEGQAGWVLLPDGRYGYRYQGSDDLIVHDGTGTTTPASE